MRKLGLPTNAPKLDEWTKIVDRIMEPRHRIRIALVGKYVELKDAYISIVEALHHAGIYHNAEVEIKRIDSVTVETQGVGVLEGAHGILVAPGFGARGVNGKLQAIRYARERKIPFLGICFGMQLACVEFAQNVCGIAKANVDRGRRDHARPGNRLHARSARLRDLRRHDALRLI